jgi:hypothetical protein
MFIVAFYAFSFDAEIGPTPELMNQTQPRLFRNFIHEDYMKCYFSHGVEGKHSFYEYVGIKNSQTYNNYIIRLKSHCTWLLSVIFLVHNIYIKTNRAINGSIHPSHIVFVLRMIVCML